jgi:ABC-type transporter Mla subunit MlaD
MARSSLVDPPVHRLLLVALIVVGVCVLIVLGVVAFFYLNGGMWPGTHTNPARGLRPDAAAVRTGS